MSLYRPEMEHDACGMGFVVQINGDKSREIVEQGLEVLRRLSHRAAVGADPETGDGAGIKLQLPHRFFKKKGLELGFDMPRRRRYAIGMVFLPPNPDQRAACEAIVEEIVASEGQRLLGWRDVPVEPRFAGKVARKVMPIVRQIYIARRRLVPSAFERKLFVIRKLVRNRIIERGVDPDKLFHFASLSAETITYKGLLLPSQLPLFYPDLMEPDMVSAIALVHSRFSTNTFPTWDLAQPFHYIAHNGEINTLRGNRNWMNARRSLLGSAKFGGRLDRLFPIIEPGRSDSAQFDNMLELLHLGGRSLPHAMMMLIPEAWEHNKAMNKERREFYEYSSALLEPWDGPAAIAFTDGRLVGATLDRNGLRPARYVITNDDCVILASEVGLIDAPASKIKAKGRLQPGRMFVVDTEEGLIIGDDRIKKEICTRWPYGRWLRRNVFAIEQFPDVPAEAPLTGEELCAQQRSFGYTDEDIHIVLVPMAETGKEPIGSMGTDTPLAVLSDRAPNLFSYFHQLFAQVTNPPIDPVRESLVMSLATSLGPDGNTFEETPEQCHRLRIRGPIVTNQDVAKIASIQEGVFEPTRLSMLYPVADGAQGLAAAVERLCKTASEAVDEGFNILILSDRGVDRDYAAIPSLLAVSATHQHLTRLGTRMQCGLLLETAEAREVHDFAVLLGHGAAAVNPYLAFDTIASLVKSGLLGGDVESAHDKYIKALGYGLKKIMSKMGISTMRSYRGAQIFEAVGLSDALVDAYFSGTPTRIGGVGLDELGEEVLMRHRRGFDGGSSNLADCLPIGGVYQWRRRGERHKWTPATIAKLQGAIASGDRELFTEYSRIIDDESDGPNTLRSQLQLREGVRDSIPKDEVEPVADIVRRFVTGAMSFGSISAEAHETLAIAMNRLGGKSNSGEGGEEYRRFTPDDNGDQRRSAIKQVASGRFGVTAYYLRDADDIQIKIAQGAKPGEGGQLPGHKVDERIARVRHSTPGVTLISPPPHHDIYSIEDLAQLIFDLQTANPRARISVKLVSEYGVGTVAAGVAKAGAGCVVIAGASGGTGASPLSSIKRAGLPWELGIAEAHQVLTQNNLRGRVRLQVDGGMRTARDVIFAALLGAEEFGFATAPLIANGCILLRKCHLNTCSVGIATQDAELRKLYAGTPEQIVMFFTMLAEQVREYMALLGFRHLDELVGHVELLEVRRSSHWKASTLNLEPLLAKPAANPNWPRRCVVGDGHRRSVTNHLDNLIKDKVAPVFEGADSASCELPVSNTDRAVGALLSTELVGKFGPEGLPDGSITVRMTGTAGQSFGAFLAPGITFQLEGDANDYVGKCLSGGRIAVFPPAQATFPPDENVIIGNTVLYGATSGALFAAGVAGERFAVRNSGATAVVEGVGDHGCEYMTGGVAVILGRTGRNFAAGMSGGIAYVFDRDHSFKSRCNLEMVELCALADESEVWLVYGLIEDHVRMTGSGVGERILDNWELMLRHFVKVLPIEYKRVLEERRAKRRSRTSQMPLRILSGGAD